jgi:vacuolar-type H+-ATPase subunit H
MASKDLLEKLFDVEHEAEAIVSAAREEAGRRVDAAKTRAQKYYTEAYDAALKKALAAREDSERAARADYEEAIETFRAKIEGSRLDEAAFAAACAAALAEAR